MKRYIVLIGILCLSGVVTLKAQQERNQGIIWSSLRGLEYTVKAGINIGGTAPVPLPREIRAIDSYRPTLCVSIEGDIKKWFGESKELQHGDHWLRWREAERKLDRRRADESGELLFLDTGRGSLPIE